VSEAGSAATASATAKAVVRWPRFMRLLRRVHLYTGLVLFPWIFFFGLSGMLFNHPNLGEDVRGRPLAAARLTELTGLRAWNANSVAAEVVAALNALERTPRYQLDPSFESRFSGLALLKAAGNGEQHMLILDVESGSGILATRRARPSGETAPFADLELPLPEHSVAAVERRVAGLLEKERVPARGELRAHPKLAPALEFRVRDQRGELWNVRYDLGRGRLNGRKSTEWPKLGLSQLFSMLHTTHHFPLDLGARWLWAFFEDFLGIAMMFWAFSGVLMWWQLKATRLWGALSLVATLGLSAAVMYATARELTFGHVAQALGPGE
jgi:hypothetical protein